MSSCPETSRRVPVITISVVNPADTMIDVVITARVMLIQLTL